MSYTLNHSDSEYIMREKIENAILEAKREKYTCILSFLNDLFKKNESSLTNFKNINVEQLLSNTKHNKSVYIKHKDVILEKFNVDFDETNISSKSFIFKLHKIIKQIEYSITKKKFGNMTLCSIKN